MNTNYNQLTNREKEVAELLAWGASKKEVADKLFLSEYTVDNHLRKIFEKTGTNKVTQLCAWYFCTRFHISFNLSPLKKAIIAGVLLLCFIPSEVYAYRIRIRRTNETRTCARYSRRFTPIRRELQL